MPRGSFNRVKLLSGQNNNKSKFRNLEDKALK